MFSALLMVVRRGNIDLGAWMCIACTMRRDLASASHVIIASLGIKTQGSFLRQTKMSQIYVTLSRLIKVYCGVDCQKKIASRDI